jgi:hypothetical protein
VSAANDLTGRAVDPDLLRVISRVAHREHLFGGPTRSSTLAMPTLPPKASNRPVRHRPVTASDVPRPTRGTTARKVTWSR